MNLDRLAGLASAIGILLLVTLAVAAAEPDFRLKDWQTLMTGFMALIAACIAYWGATAKVRHDREVVETENKRRKLALFLKIEFAFRQLSDRARNMEGVLIFPPIDEDREIGRERLFLAEPPELEEAWTYLDLFPRESIAEIRNVRNSLRNLAATAGAIDEDVPVVWRSNENDAPDIIQQARVEIYTIWQSASLVADALEPLISELAPEMDQNERIMRVYGD